MLNLKGCYVVVRESTVTVHLLTESANRLFTDRRMVVGEAKANKATFGNDALYAHPTTAACMEFIALQMIGDTERDRMLKAFCACILLGKPIPNGSEHLDGGMKVMADSDKPKPRKPRDGATVKIPSQVGAQ